MVQVKTNPKKVFICDKSLESIYTGGTVRLLQDDKIVTTVGQDLYVIEVRSGKIIQKLEGDSEVVTSFAIKPNGKHLFAVSRVGVAKLWCLEKYKPERSFKVLHEAPVLVTTIDATSTLAATGSADTTVKVWDINTGFYCTHHFRGHGGIISALKFHIDSLVSQKKMFLISGSDDGKIRVWNLVKKTCQFVLDGHSSVIRGLDVSLDGWRLVSGSRDRVVNIWELKKGTLLKSIPVLETIETVGVLSQECSQLISPAMKNIFYTAGENGQLRLWDMDTASLVLEQLMTTNAKHSYTDVLYNESENSLTAVTSDQLLLTFQLPRFILSKQLVGFHDEIMDLAFMTPFPSNFLAIATNSEKVQITNTDTLDTQILFGHSEIVLCLDWWGHPKGDSGILVTGSKDNLVKIWTVKLEEGVEKTAANLEVKCVGTCVGHTEAVGSIAISKTTPNYVITASQDKTVKCWRLDDYLNSTSGVGRVPLSEFTIQAHTKEINAIAVSPNDKMFATSSHDKTAKVWSMDTGELLGTCEGHKRGVWSVQFSPLEQTIVTSSGDKSIKLWSLNDFSCLKTFEGHTNSILRVCFINKGTQLISVASDSLIKLWSIKGEECVATLDKHTEKIWALTVDGNDEMKFATGGTDAVVNIWKDQTLEEEEKELAKKQQDMEKEQLLVNYLTAKDFQNAVYLALTMKQPRRLLRIFTDLPIEPDSLSGSPVLDSVIPKLNAEQLEQLLDYVRDWNSHAKSAMVAQRVLRAVFHSHSSEQLLQLPRMKELLDGIIPYSERHFQRFDQLLIESYLIDFTVELQ